MFCREHVVQLHRRIQDIRAAGAELVVIGNGAPHFIAGFREVTGYDGPLYTDPSLAAYRAARFKRSAWRLVHPKAALHAARALSRGFLQGRTQGDAAQQGGVLVVRPSGEVVYRYASAMSGDHPDLDEVLAALAPTATA